MNWRWAEWGASLPPAERGRPLPRTMRGAIWAVIAIVLISILAFTAAQLAPPPEYWHLL